MAWAEFVTTSFSLPHQRNMAIEGMGGAMLIGPRENNVGGD